MKTQRQKCVFAFLLILPLCVVVTMVILAKLRPRHYPAPTPVSRQRMMNWATQPFKAIEGEVDLQEIVRELPFESTVSLSDEERQILNNAVIDFIKAYQKGTFEAMTKFRLPVETYHYAASITNFMVTRCSIPMAMIQNDPAAAWKALWDIRYKDTFTNYWTGISPSNCEIRVETCTSMPKDLVDTLMIERRVPNVGFIVSGPWFILEPTSQEVLTEMGLIRLATVRILPKPRDDDVVYPVYLRMYWSPKNGKWLPDGLVSAFGRPERKVTLFF
jgi:hypothetical protein